MSHENSSSTADLVQDYLLVTIHVCDWITSESGEQKIVDITTHTMGTHTSVSLMVQSE